MSSAIQARSAQEGGATFGVRHRLFRLVWSVTWVVLAAWTPPPARAWRRWLLNLFGAKLAKGANVYASARIWYPPNLEMGAFACLGPRVTCYCMAPIRLGAYVVTSQGAHLCAGTHSTSDATFPLVTRPIVIGDRAWVAAEAFVGPGVNVGEGAVLGARAVALRNLEPWTIYTGNPAVAIRRRVLKDPPTS